MSYAVIQTGGKQYRVSEGDVFSVEKCETEAGQPIIFDKVLMVNVDDKLNVGKPYVNGMTVTGEVLAHGLTKKIPVVKFKRRQNYKREGSHRQAFTQVKITKIG